MLIFLMAVAYSLSSLAQEKTISGVITDEKDNAPLAGVSVMVKGTSIGTVTSAEGKFSLNVPSTAKFLVISLVDYVENEVAISSKTSYVIKLTSTSKLCQR
jgi:iron complex outermembrane receptor protein